MILNKLQQNCHPEHNFHVCKWEWGVKQRWLDAETETPQGDLKGVGLHPCFPPEGKSHRLLLTDASQGLPLLDLCQGSWTLVLLGLISSASWRYLPHVNYSLTLASLGVLGRLRKRVFISYAIPKNWENSTFYFLKKLRLTPILWTQLRVMMIPRRIISLKNAFPSLCRSRWSK